MCVCVHVRVHVCARVCVVCVLCVYLCVGWCVYVCVLVCVYVCVGVCVLHVSAMYGCLIHVYVSHMYDYWSITPQIACRLWLGGAS